MQKDDVLPALRRLQVGIVEKGRCGAEVREAQLVNRQLQQNGLSSRIDFCRNPVIP